MRAQPPSPPRETPDTTPAPDTPRPPEEAAPDDAGDRRGEDYDPVLQSSLESFPASDAPSWTSSRI